MVEISKNFRKHIICKKNEIFKTSFFLEKRNIFFASPEKSSPLPDIVENLKKLDSNNNGKLEDSEGVLATKTSTAEKVKYIHETAVTELKKFFKWSDPQHTISAEERARQILETATYTLESRETQHMDMIFQDYLKIFEDYTDAKSEKTRHLGVMGGSRIRTLPRSTLGIKAMDLSLENPSYLIENNMVHANRAKGGFNHLEKNFPNAKVLVIEVNGKKQVELFKTGIVKIEAVERFGVKTGIRVLDGDGDIHLYDTISGQKSVDSDLLDKASKNKRGSAIKRNTLITKKYENIDFENFNLLDIARRKVDKIISDHIQKNPEKKIDWNDGFDEVFFEKNGEIWIDTKNGIRTDFDWKNERFLETKDLLGKKASEISEFLNKNRELLFGRAIEELKESQALVKKERANAVKKSSYTNPPDVFSNSFKNKKISNIDFSDKKSKEYNEFNSSIQKILPRSKFEKKGENLIITTLSGEEISLHLSRKLSEISELITTFTTIKKSIKSTIKQKITLTKENKMKVSFFDVNTLLATAELDIKKSGNIKFSYQTVGTKKNITENYKFSLSISSGKISIQNSQSIPESVKKIFKITVLEK